MVVVTVLFLTFVLLLELLTLFRGRKWTNIWRQPFLYSLSILLLLLLSFFLCIEGEYFSSPLHNIVCAVDPRLKQETMNEVKNGLRQMGQKAHCALGLLSTSGAWIAPLSEDRVYFLLELGRLDQERSTSHDLISLKDVVEDAQALFVFFGPLQDKDILSPSWLVFQPSDQIGKWVMMWKGEKKIISSESISSYIEKMACGYSERALSSYTIGEVELFLLLLAAVLFFYILFRRSLPYLGCFIVLVFHVGLFSEDIKDDSDALYLVSRLVDAKEKEQAQVYLLNQYRVTTSSQERSLLAYDLALVSARFQKFNEAIFWAEQIEEPLLVKAEVQTFLQKLLITALFQNISVMQKPFWQNLVRRFPPSPILQTALSFRSPDQLPWVYGFEEASLLLTCPGQKYIPDSWKKELVGFARTVESSCRERFQVIQAPFLQEELHKAIESNHAERIAVLLSCGNELSSFERTLFVMRIGLRQARLYNLFLKAYSEQEGEWLKELAFLCREKKESESLLQEAWKEGKTPLDSWQRLLYLEQVLASEQPVQFEKALLLLPEVRNPDHLLPLVEEALFLKSALSTTFEEEFLSFLSSGFSWSFCQSDAFGRVALSLSSQSNQSLLPLFLDQTLSFFENTASPTPLSLVQAAQQVVLAMNGSLAQLNPEWVLSLIKRLNILLYRRLSPQSMTRQEESLLNGLVFTSSSSTKAISEIIANTYDVQKKLKQIYEIRTIEEVSPFILGERSKEVSLQVGKEQAIHLLLQLEEEEARIERSQ